MSKVNEETRTTCPRCKSGSIGPGEHECKVCAKKKPGMKNEMGTAGMGAGGFQLPIGAKARKEAIHRCIEMANDINEAHLVVFFQSAPEAMHERFYNALDMMEGAKAADIVREEVVRQTVRAKIAEVVRKKQGGGGYVLYAPNKGKKHNSKPVGSFPTKLAAKRAELARFPPKDAGKLRRLRKEVDKLMKDPKKRADVERKAMKAKGTDTGGAPKVKKPKAPKAESYSREMMEAAILSQIVIKEVKSRLTEGLFREERQGSQWDDFISKVSNKAIAGDAGYKRLQMNIEKATQASIGQATKIIQKILGGEARVRVSKEPGRTDGGQVYSPFNIEVDAASVGPIYLYVDKGLPAIEMSDEAKNSLSKVSPESAKAIRAALASAQDSLEKVSGVADAVAQRDTYLTKLEQKVDKMIAGLSPLQVSMMKQLLVKKYRGTK